MIVLLYILEFIQETFNSSHIGRYYNNSIDDIAVQTILQTANCII